MVASWISSQGAVEEVAGDALDAVVRAVAGPVTSGTTDGIMWPEREA